MNLCSLWEQKERKWQVLNQQVIMSHWFFVQAIHCCNLNLIHALTANMLWLAAIFFFWVVGQFKDQVLKLWLMTHSNQLIMIWAGQWIRMNSECTKSVQLILIFSGNIATSSLPISTIMWLLTLYIHCRKNVLFDSCSAYFNTQLSMDMHTI